MFGRKLAKLHLFRKNCLWAMILPNARLFQSHHQLLHCWFRQHQQQPQNHLAFSISDTLPASYRFCLQQDDFYSSSTQVSIIHCTPCLLFKTHLLLYTRNSLRLGTLGYVAFIAIVPDIYIHMYILLVLHKYLMSAWMNLIFTTTMWGTGL